MSAASDDRPGADARLSELLHAMRAVYGGEWSARARTRPGERDEIAELTRLFNAIAERGEGLAEELVRLRGDDAAAAQQPAQPTTAAGEPAAVVEALAVPEGGLVDAAAAALGGTSEGLPEAGRVEAVQGVGAESENRPAIVVLESADPAGAAIVARGPWGGGAMGDAARTALRGLGGTWDQAAVLSVDSADEVRAAAAGHHVVSALLDARCPAPLLRSVVAVLDAEVPGLPLLYFAPDDDQSAFDLAGTLTRGRTRAEVVRSTAQAVERLTLHWLTEAPGGNDPLTEPADPNYGQIHFEGEKVLVVDDDVRNVFAMVSALELYGLTALTADNGPEAVELLLRNPDIGIVLMDLMMPGLDGYATTARIRAYPEFAGLPIIAVTARAAPGDRERSLAAGTDEHVTKPVEVDQLLALIKRLIKH